MRDRDIAHTSISEAIYTHSIVVERLEYSHKTAMYALRAVNYIAIVCKNVRFLGLVDARGTADGLVVLRWREDNAERR